MNNVVSNIINIAKKEIGTKEYPKNSNKVKYNTEYYGRAVSGSAYPWCCAFVWWVFKQAGASSLFFEGQKTAYCPTLMNFYKKKGQLSNIPKVGSLAFFQFDTDANPEHIGIVIKVNSDGTVTTIEGNTAVGNDSNGGEVMERVRKKSLIMGYAYPYEEAKKTSGSDKTVNVTVDVLKKGSKGEAVKALQILLNGRGVSCGLVDGSFGPSTEHAVKTYQMKKKLSVDGCVGPATWGSLLGR